MKAESGIVKRVPHPLICFDDIDAWGPLLSGVLLPLAPADIQQRLQAAEPEYPADASESFLESVARDSVVGAMEFWLQSANVAGYHGTRLGAADVESIKSNGLMPLNATSRREKLIKTLSQHPKWSDVAHRLDETIAAVGPGGRHGARERQVHLTLSRANFCRGLNQYPTYGAEFDSLVAFDLLGAEGKDLLRMDGSPYVIQVAVPGAAALAAANLFSSVEKILARGEVPNIINELLEAWCYRLSWPEFLSRNLPTDCGMIFKCSLPAEWIKKIEPWQVN